MGKALVEGRKALKKELEQSHKTCAELFCDLSYAKAEERVNPRTGSVFKVIALEASPMRPFEELISQLMKKYDRAVFVGISRSPPAATGDGSSSPPHKVYLSAQRDLDCGACVKAFKGSLTLTCKPAKDGVVAMVSRGSEGSSLPAVEELITALFETEGVR